MKDMQLRGKFFYFLFSPDYFNSFYKLVLGIFYVMHYFYIIHCLVSSVTTLQHPQQKQKGFIY